MYHAGLQGVALIPNRIAVKVPQLTAVPREQGLNELSNRGGPTGLMQDETSKKEKGSRLWYKLALALVPSFATWYLKLVFATSRKVYLHQEREEEICKKLPFVIGSFHQTLVPNAFYLGRYRPVAMVSRSWDGEFIARAVEKWGYFTARGSSSRGGKEALAEMIEIHYKHKCPTGVTVDAPRGPAGKVKIGIVMLGKETGQPVVPVACWTTRIVQFNSWDKMMIPLPFSTMVFSFGKPTDVPRGLDREAYERLRLEVEEKMTEADLEAKQKVQEIKHG
jgi:lysophospholipid acyltransferase (LPLAT)-like uncharacterized protein